MKVAVIAANGRVGSLVAKEAFQRGYDVTAIVKDGSKVNGMKVIEKEITALTSEDVKGFDVIVDAFGVWVEDQLYLYSVTTKHLCDILSGSDTRLLIVGGAGSLYTDPSHTLQVYQTEGFPDTFKPLATAAAKALSELRERSNVKWTYLSPAGNFDAEGKRTGSYILGGEEAIVNSKGESYISYADYAIAMVDEIGNANYVQKRFSVVSES